MNSTDAPIFAEGGTIAATKEPLPRVQPEPIVPQQAPSTETSTKTPKFRDPWPDNARFFAAVLIVVWHMGAQVFDRSESIQLFFYATWPMRVPLYALLAGYFSSAAPITPKRGIVLLRNVLFVYLIFEMLQTTHRWALYGDFSFNPGSPSFALWFLLSLFFWRLSLPLLSRVRWIIPISIAVALIAGFASQLGSPLSASRTLAYLPIFLVGWKLHEIGLREVLDRVWVRAAAIGFYLVWFAYVYYNHSDMKRRWFSMSSPYRGEDITNELLMRGMVLTVGILGTLAILALVPRTRLGWITYLGSGSMYIYLLHPFVVRQLGYHNYFDSMNSRLDVLVMILISVAMGFIFASKPVRKVLKPLIQPSYTWLFHTDDKKAK